MCFTGFRNRTKIKCSEKHFDLTKFSETACLEPYCPASAFSLPGVSGPDSDHNIFPTSLCGPGISRPDNHIICLVQNRSELSPGRSEPGPEILGPRNDLGVWSLSGPGRCLVLLHRGCCSQDSSLSRWIRELVSAPRVPFLWLQILRHSSSCWKNKGEEHTHCTELSSFRRSRINQTCLLSPFLACLFDEYSFLEQCFQHSFERFKNR